MYSAFVLDEETRVDLALGFIPQYEKFIGHHVTEHFGIREDKFVPRTALVRVVGHVDNGSGLEALVCSVDGSITRPVDGKLYHITWSLDPDKYKPVHSNDLLASKRWTIVRPFTLGELDLSFLTA